MNEILDLYKVSFRSQLDLGKRMASINDWLSLYITDHDSVTAVDALLDDINRVLAGEYSEGGDYTQGFLYSVIDSNHTKIYENMDEYIEDNTIAPSFSLPTLHFKAILEAWRAYLL